jgi:glyoxylase-like metal-dependent hydrolase (beta-lactamase superfamily II)
MAVGDLTMTAKIDRIADDLSLITLNPPLDGFENFISAWLVQGEITFLVDVGPASTANGLVAVLAEAGVNHLDYVLLTHIHLDHAGAIGQIAAAFPKTPIVCHPAGIPHLVEPSRLWAGTRKVLGATAEGYGPVRPVAGERFLDAQKFESEIIAPILTPGHAAHHVSYHTPRWLFAGETGGVYYAISPQCFYLRPATPPRFFLDTAVESIDKLIAANPDQLCYGHYGMTADGVNKLQTTRRQLFSWKAIIAEEIEQSDGDRLMAACLERILKDDPLTANFDRLPQAAKARETYFLKNSINGFIGYLKND